MDNNTKLWTTSSFLAAGCSILAVSYLPIAPKMAQEDFSQVAIGSHATRYSHRDHRCVVTEAGHNYRMGMDDWQAFDKASAAIKEGKTVTVKYSLIGDTSSCNRAPMLFSIKPPKA